MNTKKILVSVVLLISFITSPLYAQAGFWDIFDPLRTSRIFAKSANNSEKARGEENQDYFSFSLFQNDSVLATRPLAVPKTFRPKKTYTVSITGYSSTPEQTDHTPFITAAGTHVRDGVIAANFLPFGTIIKIPELFGDKTFIVEDRMNSRYWLNVDIWFPEKNLAKEFGVKVVKIEIVS